MRFLDLLIGIVIATLFCVPFACMGNGNDSGSQENDDDTDIPNDDDQAQADDDQSDDDVAPPSIYDNLQPVGPVIGEALGIASQMSTDPEEEWKRDFELDKMAEIGIDNIRCGWSWHSVEIEPGVWDFSATDVYRQIIRERGVRWDARLAYAPEWEMPNGSPSEIDLVAWTEYIHRMAARYCGDVTTFEIWNEPNLYHFWEPIPDPEKYGELLKTAYNAIKTECPEAAVLFGGLSSTNWPQEWNFGTYPFFDRVVESHPDICEYFDVMAVHPYTILQYLPPEFSLDLDFLPVPDLSGQVDDIRERMSIAGCGKKPVLFSEFGWPHTYIGHDKQADYLVRTILLGTAKQVSGYFLYTFWDKIEREPITENHFGLYEYPESSDAAEHVAKPAFYALKNLSDLLGHARFAGDLTSALFLPHGANALAFFDNEKDKLIVGLWAGKKSAEGYEVKLPTPNGIKATRVVDQYGGEVAGNWGNLVYFSLSKQVIFVEFSLNSIR